MSFLSTKLSFIEFLTGFQALFFLLLKHTLLRAVLDEKSSQECPINAWVPQGPILGPSFFLLHIKDILDIICIYTIIYIICIYTIAIDADDTTLYLTNINLFKDNNRNTRKRFNILQS